MPLYFHCRFVSKSNRSVNPNSTGRRFRYAHGDLGFSLKLFQIAAKAIWGLDASSTLPLRFYYASVMLLLRFHYDNVDLATLSLRWWRWSCDLATTLAMELGFRCAFVSFLYRIWNSDTLLLRPKRFYCASTALLPFLLRFVSFCPKFRIVAESPSSGLGV